MENLNPYEILSYGVIGLGFLLAFFAYRLLSSEQKKETPRKQMLKAIQVFMVFSIILCIIGFGAEILKPNYSKVADSEAEPDAGSEKPIASSEDKSGKVSVEGELGFDYRMVFTSALKKNEDGDTEPLDALDKIGIKDKQFYVFAEFYHLEIGKNYRRVIKIYNNRGEFITAGTWDFIPTGNVYWTSQRYSLDPKVDKPGKWTIRLYLNGEELAEKELLIVEGKTIEG
jgi:hypothetical protein